MNNEKLIIEFVKSLNYHSSYQCESAWIGHEYLANFLIKTKKPKIIVELGVHNGFSYFNFCQSVHENKLNSKCFGIDHWKGDPHASFYDETVYKTVLEENKKYYYFSELIQKDFDSALVDFKDRTIDFLHIDGYHTFEAVKSDFNNWLPKCKKEALILFHDVNEFKDDFGVYKFFNELKKKYNNYTSPHAHGLGIISLSNQKNNIIEFLNSFDLQSNFSSLLLDNYRQLLKKKKQEKNIKQQSKTIETLNQTLSSKDQEIHNLNSTLTQRTEETEQQSKTIETLNQTLSSKDQEIHNLNSTLTQRTEETEQQSKTIETLNQTLSSKDQEIHNLNSTLTQRTEETEQQSKTIETLNQTLSSKDQEIHNLNSTLTQRTEETEQQSKTIETLNQTLSSKDQEIHNLNSTLTQRTEETEQQSKTIETLNQTLSSKDQEIHNLNSTLTQRTEETEQQSKTIETLNQTLSSKDQEIHHLSSSLTRLRAEIKQMMNSNSYKYTALLRELRRIVTNPIDRLKYHIDRLRDNKYFFLKKKIIVDESNRLQNDLKNLKKKINLNFYQNPKISIIIPVYNQINFTLNCLESISNSKNYTNYEIIIVNDASTDITNEYLKEIKNLKIITNSENLGFIKSCNLGAEEAKGEFLYFLNNDTLIKDYSIDELFNTFLNLKNVGLVGSKLIYPNNKLQEAGGIIWNDASGWNYGNGKDKDHINFNYARDVDYCSGASIMIPKQLFLELGMFDNYFAPAYYEDTDLAFKVREKNLRVIYQPLSEVIHFEGVTSGTDINSGAKQNQKINKEKFFIKHQDLLVHHYNNGEHVDKAIDRTKVKNCLVIDTVTPTPDRDSGSIDTYNQLMFLQNHGFQTTFIPLDNFAKIQNYTQDLQKKGIKCIYYPYYNNIETFFKDHQNFFDLILINREENFTNINSFKKKYFSNAKLWLHNVDLNFIRLARQAKIEKNFKLIKKAKEIKNSEITNNINADISSVVSSFELNYLKNKNINCELLSLFRNKSQKKIKSFEERNGLVFIAGFNHLPNQDALTYFLDDIFSSVQKHLPDVQFSIIGNNLPKNLFIKIKKFQNVHYYPDISNAELEELVNNHKIGIAPLRYGAGIKGKVITYIANHLPFIASPVALEGFDKTNIIECIYFSKEDFINKLLNLYQNKNLYESVVQNLSSIYEQNFSQNHYELNFSKTLNKINLY